MQAELQATTIYAGYGSLDQSICELTIVQAIPVEPVVARSEHVDLVVRERGIDRPINRYKVQQVSSISSHPVVNQGWEQRSVDVRREAASH